jgi:hypothetical protein
LSKRKNRIFGNNTRNWSAENRKREETGGERNKRVEWIKEMIKISETYLCPERNSNPRLAGWGTLYRAKLFCQKYLPKSIAF